MRFERAPTIETPRLRLRAHRPDDFEACAAMWADPAVTAYIGAPSTRLQTWARMRGYVGLWEFLGFGYWAIEETATGRFIGELGFADFKREIAATMQGIPELGWALADDARGKGLATEAVRAATAWGDRHLRSERTVCLIDARNAASIRVAEKSGFLRFDAAATGTTELIFFERHRPTTQP